MLANSKIYLVLLLSLIFVDRMKGNEIKYMENELGTVPNILNL